MVEEHRCQSRGGVGIIAIDASERNGAVVDLDLVTEAMELMVITDRGQIIRTKVSEVRQAGRNTQGVRIIRLDSDEKVVAVEPVAEPEAESGSSESLVPPMPTEPEVEATPE